MQSHSSINSHSFNFLRKNLVWIFLSISYLSQSQDTLTPNWIFAEIVGVGKILSKKLNVSIDYGQEGARKSRHGSANRMVDDDGKEITFNSMVDALNFMSGEGWEFVQAYVVSDMNGMGGNTNIYRWLLKIKASPGEKGELLPMIRSVYRKEAIKE